MPLNIGRSYGVFAGNVPFQPGDFVLESSQDNIIAGAGGGISNAFQLTTQTARITTVVTVGDSIMLPPSAPGLELLVVNHGANAMQVFGNGGDLIDDQAATVGVAQMMNSNVIYTSATAGNWYTEGLSTGFSKNLGLQTLSYKTVAGNVTLTQAAGTAITTLLNNVTGAAATAVTLPPSAPGLEITVHNISGFTVSVFPNAGGTGTETINGLAANAAQAMPTNTSTVYTCAIAGQWYSIPRTPS